MIITIKKDYVPRHYQPYVLRNAGVLCSSWGRNLFLYTLFRSVSCLCKLQIDNDLL